jgi:hypothetical protein
MDYGIVLKFISALSSPDKGCFLASINQMWTRCLLQGGISYWYYRNCLGLSILKAEVVANCHKVPQKEFGKTALQSIQESITKPIQTHSFD